MKKSIIILFSIIFLISFISAQAYKIGISTIPEDKIFESGEKIQVKITIYDDKNNIVNDIATLIFQDLKEQKISETTIQTNKFEEITLNENILSGEGKIIAEYQDSQTEVNFFIREKMGAQFELIDDKLKITNTGNTEYNKKVYITIGETTGTKTPKISLGKSITYRLVAPEGTYNIKVTDGENTLTFSNVPLKGTGQVIGALDNSPTQRTGITGGLRPEEKSETGFLSYVKNANFIYIFILVIFGATILLAVERRYKKKAE